MFADIDKAKKSSIRALSVIRKMEREQEDMATELGLSKDDIEKYQRDAKLRSRRDDEHPEGFWANTYYYTFGTVKMVAVIAVSPIYAIAECMQGNNPIEKVSPTNR